MSDARHTSNSAQDTLTHMHPSQEKPSRMVPIELESLMQDRPLFSCEDIDVYDDLLSRMIAYYAPRDAVEFILVKDMADEQWHARRYRRMREAMIHDSLVEVAWSQLKEAWMSAHAALAEDQAHAADDRGEVAPADFREMMMRDRQGDAGMRDLLDGLMDAAGLTHDQLYQAAQRRITPGLSALEDMLAQAEKRRDELMRMIEERRRTSSTMSRALLKAEDRASAEDIPLRMGGC